MIITTFDPVHTLLDGERVMALGFFDGVHLAHRRLLAMAKAQAEKTGAEFAVFTFPSDSATLKGGVERIYPTEEKLALLAEAGVERVVLAEFPTVAHLSAEAFVRDVLIDRLKTRTAVCGYNFRFAEGARAETDDLVRLMRLGGGDAVIGEEVRFCGEPLSATWIRDRLRRGEIRTANEALGAPYHLIGTVEHGKGLARTFGYPTLNLPIPPSCLSPKSGVYRSAVRIENRTVAAITNIGTCPTFGSRPVHAETYLIDENRDLYAKKVCVFLLDFLRPERPFPDAESLQKQIKLDINRAMKENEEDIWLTTGQN